MTEQAEFVFKIVEQGGTGPAGSPSAVPSRPASAPKSSISPAEQIDRLQDRQTRARPPATAGGPAGGGGRSAGGGGGGQRGGGGPGVDILRLAENAWRRPIATAGGLARDAIRQQIGGSENALAKQIADWMGRGQTRMGTDGGSTGAVRPAPAAPPIAQAGSPPAVSSPFQPRTPSGARLPVPQAVQDARAAQAASVAAKQAAGTATAGGVAAAGGASAVGLTTVAAIAAPIIAAAMVAYVGKKTYDFGVRKSEELSSYSPEIAAAVAQNVAAKQLQRLEQGRVYGETFGDFERNRGRLGRAMSDIGTAAMAPLVEDLSAFLKIGAVAAEGVAKLLEKADPESVADFFAKSDPTGSLSVLLNILKGVKKIADLLPDKHQNTDWISDLLNEPFLPPDPAVWEGGEIVEQNQALNFDGLK